ncbi:hypothetical protein FWH13_03995 [Candidatus Saccharibacteria bacterium]|nr:hypothetical protein [Candidatus Saccharibacteria bacterium]
MKEKLVFISTTPNRKSLQDATSPSINDATAQVKNLVTNQGVMRAFSVPIDDDGVISRNAPNDWERTEVFGVKRTKSTFGIPALTVFIPCDTKQSDKSICSIHVDPLVNALTGAGVSSIGSRIRRSTRGPVRGVEVILSLGVSTETEEKLDINEAALLVCSKLAPGTFQKPTTIFAKIPA